MTGQALTTVPREVRLATREGSFEITDRALVATDPRTLQEFERALLLESRREGLDVKMERDFPRAVTVISWRPALNESHVGVWRLV